MKTSKLATLFLESVKRGVSEEVGSIDSFSYRGKNYFVNKTDEKTFALFEENSFAPIAEHKTDSEPITEVVFRKWKNGGEIVALFPYEIQNVGGYCLSYEHVGQHSDADYIHCIINSKPANESEYADLKAELEGIGYKLKVGQKINYNRYHMAIIGFREKHK